MVLTDDILVYTPDQLKDYAMSMMAQLTLMLFAALGMFFILYILSAIALSTISKKLKFNNPYIAWIPLAAPYVEGKIYDYMKSDKLDKSSTRIHYPMLNIVYSLLWCGNYLYTFLTSISQCLEMYNTGTIPMSLMGSTSTPIEYAITALITVLSILLAFFRIKSLIFAYICFDKNRGGFLLLLSAIFPYITPFLYFSLSKLTPVNTKLKDVDFKIM